MVHFPPKMVHFPPEIDHFQGKWIISSQFSLINSINALKYAMGQGVGRPQPAVLGRRGTRHPKQVVAFQKNKACCFFENKPCCGKPQNKPRQNKHCFCETSIVSIETSHQTNRHYPEPKKTEVGITARAFWDLLIAFSV